jgi:hypothetical protein
MRNGCPVNSHDPMRNLVQLEACHVLGKAGRADVHVAVCLEELGDVPACLGPVLIIMAPDEEEEGNPHQVGAGLSLHPLGQRGPYHTCLWIGDLYNARDLPL